MEGIQAGLNQPLFKEGIPHLHRGAIIQGRFGQLRRGKAGATHAVPTGRTADVDHREANALRPRAHDRLGLHQTQGHRVDQGVAGIAGVEGHLSTDGGHPDAVAVMGNAGHHAFHQAHVALVLERAKPEGVQQGNRTGTHGEDVPQNAAHAGGRALERLHR